MKYFSLTLFLLFQFINVRAQLSHLVVNSTGGNSVNSFEYGCATDEMTKELYKKHPDRKKKAEEIDAAIYEQLKNKGYSKTGVTTAGLVYTIPVVVHIIHNNGPENISNAQVMQGIQDLNDAFANKGAYQDANGTDIEIQFCLAQRDPNGNTTNGITRDVSTLTNMVKEMDDVALKKISPWDPKQYLNIWLVKAINSISSGPSVVGYANYASSHGHPEDGIVNEASYFGSSPKNSGVHVHEAGHYLALIHTFEGGCKNNNCLTDGDKVCDTPPDNSTVAAACNASVNTCTTDADDLSINNPFRPVANGGLGDQNDLFHDHMDYGDLTCHNLFTQGQKDRIRLALTGPRASLLQSKGCQTPCTSLINLVFVASSTTVTVGTTVNFTNATTGAINFNWSINNNSFAASQNSAYTFNVIGGYWVVLTANNNDPNCIKKDSVWINVKCSATSSITASANIINVGGSVTFTSTSAGAATYQWYLDGIPQVNTPNFTHLFPTTGGFIVYLVTCNGACCDTSNYQFIQVGLCTSKEANNWIFGNHHWLDFSGGGIPVYTPITAPGSFFGGNEGCSSISDANGQLLFFTDGIKVWDKNFQPMQNGTGLWGHFSTTQSALILKKPGSKSRYYIFTCDFQGGEFNSPHGGAFAYAEVDMTANGGLGSVIAPSKLIYKPTTEKQTSVRHSNGTDTWIVTHEWKTDKFRSYRITCSGLDTTAVISQTGMIHIGSANGQGSDALGQMVISPNGKRLALVTLETGCQFFDFNTSTGVVSNPISFNPSGIPNFFPYGVAFSLDGSKLYFGTFAGDFQLDLSLGSPTAIINSAINLGHPSTGSMQLAPDGKIYTAHYDGVSSTNYLNIINNPNIAGLGCNYVFNAITLNGTIQASGLPNLLIDYFASKKAAKIQGDTLICKTSKFFIKNNCGLGGDSIVWNLHGSSTIISKVDSVITIKPNKTGVDTLIAKQFAPCGMVADTLLIHTKVGAGIINLGKDTTICTPTVLLNAGAGYPSYLWNTNATTQSITANTSGTYWVQVNDANGCSSVDSIKVKQTTQAPKVNLGPDKIVCPNKVQTLDAGAGYVTYLWQDNSFNQIFTACLPGIYWVTATDSCGNSSTDTIKIKLDYSGALSIGKDTSICTTNNFMLDAGGGYINYLWQDGSTGQNYTVSSSGIFYVQATTSDGCAYVDSIIVQTKIQAPNVNLGADKILCKGKAITIDAGLGYLNYTWQDNSHTQTFTTPLPGTYWVTAKDSCGNSSRDTVKIKLDNTGIISIGKDTALCPNDNLILNAGNGYASYLWQNGSTNQNYTATGSGIYYVQVTTTDGCTYMGSIKVTTKTDCNPSVTIKDCEIGVPDAFSPNGDGLNDELHVLGKCIDKITFVIYNRWGEKVFESTSPTQGWDGTLKGQKLDNGVFAYYLKAITFKGTEINLKGNISLIR